MNVENALPLIDGRGVFLQTFLDRLFHWSNFLLKIWRIAGVRFRMRIVEKENLSENQGHDKEENEEKDDRRQIALEGRGRLESGVFVTRQRRRRRRSTVVGRRERRLIISVSAENHLERVLSSEGRETKN